MAPHSAGQSSSEELTNFAQEAFLDLIGGNCPEARVDTQYNPRLGSRLFFHQLIIGRAAAETGRQHLLENPQNIVADQRGSVAGQLTIAEDIGDDPVEAEA